MPGMKSPYNMCPATFNKYMKLVQLASNYELAFTICFAAFINL